MTSAAYSVTVHLFEKSLPTLSIDRDDNGWAKFGKLALGVVAYPVFAVAMLVEGVARGILSLIFKAICFFIPKESCKSFHQLEGYLSQGASRSLSRAGFAFGSFFEQFHGFHVDGHEEHCHL